LQDGVNRGTYRNAFDIGVIVGIDRHGDQASKAQEGRKSRQTHIEVELLPNWGKLKDRPGVGWMGLRCHQDPRTQGTLKRIERKKRNGERRIERAKAGMW